GAKRKDAGCSWSIPDLAPGDAGWAVVVLRGHTLNKCATCDGLGYQIDLAEVSHGSRRAHGVGLHAAGGAVDTQEEALRKGAAFGRVKSHRPAGLGVRRALGGRRGRRNGRVHHYRAIDDAGAVDDLLVGTRQVVHPAVLRVARSRRTGAAARPANGGASGQGAIPRDLTLTSHRRVRGSYRLQTAGRNALAARLRCELRAGQAVPVPHVPVPDAIE